MARSGRSLGRLVQRFRERRFSIGIALALFLAINLLLLFGYLWSHGGQTTHVRIEARGDEFTAYVDGRPALSASFDAPSEGGLVLTLKDTDNVPSMPKPRGIDSVRVTDLTSGEVLFEDDFSSGYEQAWTVVSGVFSSEDGVLAVEGDGTLALTDRAWRDYAVDVTYRNILNTGIRLRAPDKSTGVAYRFRPPAHEFALIDQGNDVDIVKGKKVELRRSEELKSLVAVAVNPYPLALLLLAGGLAAVAVLQWLRAPRVLLKSSSLPASLPWLAAGALALGAFGIVLFLNTSYVLRMPRVPDETGYIFQAKLLAMGRLSAPLPPVPQAFEFFSGPPILLSDGKWASAYPFGHPLMLAIGVKLGALWLIPPLVGAACVALIFSLGRKLYNDRVGLLAALLLTTSPLFLTEASNFMSHSTAVFYLLASLLFLSLLDRRPILYGLLAGLFFGLLFNTRPLTAMGLIPPFGFYLLSGLVPRERRRLSGQQVAAFVAGGLVMLAALLLYNYGTLGDPLTTGYQSSGNLGERVGFGGGHSINVGIQNEEMRLKLFLLVLNGWPQYIGLTFVLLPFILATRNRWDWFLLACAISVMGVWILYDGQAAPRYWYESIPFLMLLSARGADRAAELLADAAGSLRRALVGTDGRPLWAGTLVVYALVFALVGGSLYGWLLGKEEGWRVGSVPVRAASLQGLFGVDDRLVKLIDDANLDNALILVEDCPRGWQGQQCYTSVFWMNSPMLDGDVVIARDVEGRRAELLRAFPDRAVYLATYRPPTLVALAQEEQPPDSIAGDTPSVTPTPNRTDTARREGEPAAPSGTLQ